MWIDPDADGCVYDNCEGCEYAYALTESDVGDDSED